MMFLNAVYLIACVSPATMTSTSMTANLSGFASMSINHTGHAEVSFFGQVWLIVPNHSLPRGRFVAGPLLLCPATPPWHRIGRLLLVASTLSLPASRVLLGIWLKSMEKASYLFQWWLVQWSSLTRSRIKRISPWSLARVYWSLACSFTCFFLLQALWLASFSIPSLLLFWVIVFLVFLLFWLESFLVYFA